MTTTFKATFDGKVFHPVEPVNIPPNTEVRLTIEDAPASSGFLDTAESLGLEGPEDWAERFEAYLQEARAVSDG